MKGMTRRRAVALAPPILAVILALSLATAHAAGPDCRRGIPPSPDCPEAIASPPGLPSHGGTVTVHPGITLPCIVGLPGGARLCAGGETAAPYGLPGSQPSGRAIFRVSGSGLDTPGVNIVVSRSGTNAPNGPELLPQLAADAVVLLPPGAVLLRFDTGTGRYFPVPTGHIRQAGDTLYKILRRGAAPTFTAATALPRTIPATGGSPFGALLAVQALLLLAGLGLARDLWLRRGHPRGEQRRAQTRIGVLLSATGFVLLVATGTALAVLAGRGGPAGFGTLAEAGGSAPRALTLPGPPVRLTIARLGIDTPVIPLHIVDGTWQTPSFAAGYLAGDGTTARNAVITGHDDRDGAVFRRLGELRAGDIVQVVAGGHHYRYAVTALRTIAAGRVDVLQPTRGAVLTLITCTPYLVDTERLVARAALVSQA